MFLGELILYRLIILTLIICAITCHNLALMTMKIYLIIYCTYIFIYRHTKEVFIIPIIKSLHLVGTMIVHGTIEISLKDILLSE